MIKLTRIIRKFSEVNRLATFEERYEYLKLKGDVGRSTFGFDRWINQQFYTSSQWKSARNQVITRDLGMDLGLEGYEIYDKIIVHHMNPMTPEDIEVGDPSILDPNFLICTTHTTHNAIHFGDSSLLTPVFQERTRGDTKLW